MINNQFITEKFGFLGLDFIQELEKCSIVTDMKSKIEIVSPGQRIHYVPILIKGSVRVFTLNEGRELLYYYMKPGESCIMTFASIFKNCISSVYACTEESSKALLIPVSSLLNLMGRFPAMNNFFYNEYDNRFTSLMSMVNDAVFHKLDTRVLNYISQRAAVTGNNPVKITHKDIALGLGTSREVISRVLKKLVNEARIIQHKTAIEIIAEKT
ncbi:MULTISPECIES: Crp/Fnr family transcriptional regulator [Chryseobacterium]|uniref:Crp/Fnr family transcriptional regulator n=1 Tax=Chryseobacterium bernardetii TaxID=1241978 RepID=A0A3G6TKX8_9FLAO|nr:MULTISPECIES: Crp/Fnr family transcriptional regulator [Chryseobacterium]AZB26720.1 Crp/Fnr family transcriptional regulator [Chryseobacterium bernardetii]AZB33201.1 Crp/Fnr family transcriptional regulator [Chryseobacterium bernardetii]UCA61010.1 Crp/Fnr family transcriptional regulator [Chryseobacterium rhizoplanae]